MAFDAQITATSNNSTTPFGGDIDIADEEGRVLLISIAAASIETTEPTVTLEGVSLGAADIAAANGSHVSHWLWIVENPTAGAGRTISATPGPNSAFHLMRAVSWNGLGELRDSDVSQNFGTSPSITLTTESGDVVIDFLAIDDGDSYVETPPTDDEDSAIGTPVIAGTGGLSTMGTASSEVATGESTTAGWTISASEVFTQIAVAFAPAGASDETAPTLSSATASAVSDTTGSGSVSTDEDNGTLYWVVTQSSTAPSAAQVKAGTDESDTAADDSGSQAVSTTGTQNVSGGFTGLTAETTYYAHFMHEDEAENQSSVASSSSFTTEATPTAAAPSPLVGDSALLRSPLLHSRLIR